MGNKKIKFLDQKKVKKLEDDFTYIILLSERNIGKSYAYYDLSFTERRTFLQSFAH